MELMIIVVSEEDWYRLGQAVFETSGESWVGQMALKMPSDGWKRNWNPVP